MEQDYYISPETKTDNEVSEKPSDQNEKKPLDPYLTIIALQSIICAAVLILCFIIKMFFGDLFLQIDDWYQKNINVDTDINQVLDNSSAASGTGGPLETEVGGIDLSSGFAMPVTGAISSSYGYRTDPFSGTAAIHGGIDIAAESGSKIVAALSGKVLVAERGHADYGNYIILEHGGFKTLYAHCLSLKVSVGDIVSKGQTIALCGSTGRSTGPHLHFEIRVGNSKIDPSPFLNLLSDDKY